MTFRDGDKGQIIGKGTLNVVGLLKLEGVLYFKGLKANLISISHLGDQNMSVKFTSKECKVFDDERNYILK